jgi:hypothetical protein
MGWKKIRNVNARPEERNNSTAKFFLLFIYMLL